MEFDPATFLLLAQSELETSSYAYFWPLNCISLYIYNDFLRKLAE